MVFLCRQWFHNELLLSILFFWKVLSFLEALFTKLEIYHSNQRFRLYCCLYGNIDR